MEPQFKMALPEHVSVEKFVRVAMTAIQSNPDLLDANRTTLFAELTKCAADGLIPDGREAALVVYNTKKGKIAKYLPMIGGILKKIRNSGDLISIMSQLIHENDDFQFWVDEGGEHVKHHPMLFADRGQVIGAYALAKTKDGGVYIEVMSEEQLEAVKNVSRAKDGPWQGAFADEMRRKTVVRRLSKRLPMSSDLDEVLRRDDDLYELNKEPKKEIENKPTRLKELMTQEIDIPENVSEEIPNPFKDEDGKK
jgi:recombination protein RecT